MKALLDNRYSESAVGSFLVLHPSTVSRWNKRFQGGEGVRDRPRSGRPPKIEPETVQKVVAFYCQHKPLPGCAGWSVRWMAVYFEKHPEFLDVPISASSVHRCLASDGIKLYRRKYFLQICDPLFFEKMDKILRIYKIDPEGLFCFDECTGLQILQRIAPDLPADSTRPEYREFEYVRHGTVSIISFLEKRTGKVFTESIPDHASTTIINSVKRHAGQYGSYRTLHYICDNYSSHSTEEFCRGIAELCGIRPPVLKTVIDRKQWLESSDKRIVFHFLPSHGSWLNLVEIWFSILKRKALADRSFSSAAEKTHAILDFNETWNTHFAHPFKWTYDGADLHEKAVRRLIKWLQIEAALLTGKFLEKQFVLMYNLFLDYNTKISLEHWTTLQNTLVEKRDFIAGTIDAVVAATEKAAQEKRENLYEMYLALTEQLAVYDRAA
ncbi:MAG: IS630 family transposase [Proteobacteria bacterium]|nr:IS630 family transposase [Pseudomonadota bacterium]